MSKPKYKIGDVIYNITDMVHGTITHIDLGWNYYRFEWEDGKHGDEEHEESWITDHCKLVNGYNTALYKVLYGD